MLLKDFLKYKPSKRIEIPLILILILIVFFITTFSFTREIFLFQTNRAIFTFSSDYLYNYTSKPGGLLEYAGNFITQGFYNYPFGILILSLFLVLSWVILFKINKLLSDDGAPPILFTLIPVCLFLICFNNFYFFIHYALGCLLASACFLFTVSGKKSYFIFLFFYPLLFYVTGPFSFIYAGMSIIRVIVTKKGWPVYILPVLMLLYAYLTFAVFKNLLFLQPVNVLLAYPLLVPGTKELPLFLFIFAGYTVLLPLIFKWAFLLRLNSGFSGIIPVTLFLSLIPVGIYLFPGQDNSDLAEITRIENAVYEQDWDSVIEQYEKSNSTNLILYYYNLALANKNQLCEKLFYARHPFGAESLTLSRSGENVDRAVYYYYTIGLINEAHHLAYESMVKYGFRPENIKMLVKTNLINKKYSIAERYINVLSKTIHFKDLARHYKEMLNNPDLINTDSELGRKREMLPKNDFFIRDFDDQNIELFLMANPCNKTAFEYKIARLLIEKDIETMIYEIKYMKGMGYTSIPRHIEEAILTYSKTIGNLPDLGGLAVSPECEMQYARFNTLIMQKNVDKSWLKNEMKEKWGNTFWYYFQFE